MADWKTRINYNYNPGYLAYVFQPGQNAGNLDEPEDFSSNNVGVTQNYYSTTAETQEESPPRTPEQNVSNGQYHYQGSGVLYIGAETDQFLLDGSRQAADDEQTLEAKRASIESTSDTETYISPDSWGSIGSREEVPLQTDPAAGNKKDLSTEKKDRSPGSSQDVSSSHTEDQGNGSTSVTQSPQSDPKNQGSNAKAKVRTSFSESQMNILIHTFSCQRYLPPAEMKNLAEVTGLTYKQVRTWFQNRRMKLRRHQKDNSWVSERYAIINGTPVQGPVYNIPPSYQEEGRPQHRMDPAFKNNSPQNVAFYMAAVGPGSTGYPPWATVPCQAAVPMRNQPRDWPANPHVFNVAGFGSGQLAGFEGKNGEVGDSS